ncbi:30S ribosomal protein S2 [Candidatus Berkelbacteria bacterium RBG_13_40_8]|uniref:Small ribosomal subunit protein uS2 n=1 Tax=Candidatus Berkelbacteria bacterium RBG_13_40_8 TaxID=1797467 RepID=A0A1F5DM60_9BACT|nr:MAG: 30S ribosomal protein S2 [Candidatus Berkelbacteria bacterium RBG_13_40_8]
MPTLVEMLEAGVHFGHKKERSHPRAKDFIFTLKEGVYVIDLDKTRDCLEKALEFLKRQASSGKTILFIGTKRQAKEIVRRVAENVHMPYVTHRWLGGTLTNFETIKRNLTELERIESQVKTPEFDVLTKKEKKIITDKLNRLQITFEGIKDLKSLPDVVFIVDAKKESGVIAEANRMEIPVVAICDTDASPDKINYPIPSNDDAPKSIEIIMNVVEDSLRGSKEQEIVQEQEKGKQEEKKEEIKPIKRTTKKTIKISKEKER